jgi:predicted dehydrogenase
VASPPRYHTQQTLQLLQAGVAVLCEKPMAITLGAAEVMVACAEATQRLLAIGLVRRFFPATQMIHDLLTRESLGPVQSFRYAEGEPFRWPVQSATYFQKETAQGGVLLDIGVHVLDLLTWWWGQPVDVRYGDDAMGGLEANCRLQLQFAQGHTGEVRLSRDTMLANRLTIECARGTIHWQVKEPDKVQVTFADVALGLDGVVSPRADTGRLSIGEPVEGSFEQCFLNQLHNVVSAIQGQDDLRVTGADGLPSLQLIERCYQQRELMEMAWLDEHEQRQARQFSRARNAC